MNLRFLWNPLIPPKSGAKVFKSTIRLSDWGAFVFLGLGIFQVILGLHEGPLRFASLAIGILLFGLPHGAVDHLIAIGLAGKPLERIPLLTTISLYLLAMLSVFALWVYYPVIAALGFLLMTIYHWGKSDLIFERTILFDSPEFRGPIISLNHSVLRGMIPICVPFIAFPDQADEFLSACIGLFSSEHTISFQNFWGWLVLAFSFSFLIDQSIYLLRIRELFSMRLFIENILLVLFFGLVPPLLAIGFYFAGWHGLRHIVRICHYDSEGALPVLSVAGRIRTFAVQAFPFTLISILILAGLLGGLIDRVAGAYEGVALYLVLISALTFPHLIIVEWMDYHESTGN